MKPLLKEIFSKTIPNSASHFTALSEIRWPQSENNGFDAYLFALLTNKTYSLFLSSKTTKDQTLTHARTHIHMPQNLTRWQIIMLFALGDPQSSFKFL